MGQKLFSYAKLSNPQSIIVIRGRHRRLFNSFISHPLARDGVEYQYRSRRFWQFATAEIDVAISQYLAVRAFVHLEHLFEQKTEEIEFLRFLGRNSHRMTAKHADTARLWMSKSGTVDRHEFSQWRTKYRIATRNLISIEQNIERILENDLLSK